MVVDLATGQPVESAALGRTLAAYPLLACRGTRLIQRIYLVADTPDVKSVGLQHEAVILDADPPGGNGPRGLFLHGAAQIIKELDEEGQPLESLSLLFTHAATVTTDLVEKALEELHGNSDVSAVLSVSQAAAAFSPFNARALSPSGILEPLAPAKPGPQPEAWFPDWGLAVMRGEAVKRLCATPSTSPAPWLELKAAGLKQWGPGPVEHAWQIPAVEHWLKAHGFSDLTPTRELQPQPKPQPKSQNR